MKKIAILLVILMAVALYFASPIGQQVGLVFGYGYGGY